MTEGIEDEGEDEGIDDYNEIVERDKLIYDCIKNRYNFEWDRFKILDGKASGIISFVGIILALQGGIGATLLKDTLRTGALFITMINIFILSVICLTFSIICGLRAYFLQKWIYIPEVHNFINECAVKDKSRVDILRVITQSLSRAIESNKKDTNKKARFIEYGFAFLAVGLILNLFFIIGVTIIMSY
jgi:hypothetical protein